MKSHNQVDNSSSNVNFSIFAAVQNNDMTLLMKILNSQKFSKDWSSLDYSEWSPLHYAVMFDHVDMVRELLLKGVNSSCVGRGKQQPLHVAAVNNSLKSAELLVTQSRLNINSIDVDGQTPLIIAVTRGYIDMVQLLLTNRGDADVTDTFSVTSLHYAVRAHNLALVEILTLHINKLIVDDRDGVNPLMAAAIEGNRECFHKILTTAQQRNFDIREILDLRDSTGETCLTHSAHRGYLLLVQDCVQNGANPHVANKNGQSALHIACAQGHQEIVIFLLSLGVNTNASDLKGKSPLHVCVERNRIHIAELLIQSGVNVNSADLQMTSPLHQACHIGNVGFVKLLLEHRASVHVRDCQLNSAIHVVGATNNMVVMRAVIDSITDSDQLKHILETRDQNGFTALHLAAENQNVEMCDYLVTKGANTSAISRDGRSPIHLAASTGCLDCLKIFTSGNKVGYQLKDRRGMSAFLLVAFHGHTQCFKTILETGVDLYAKNCHGQNALMLASEKNNLDIIRILLDQGMDVNVLDHKNSTALHYAACNNHRTSVELLLSARALIIENNDGETPLDVSLYSRSFIAAQAFVTDQRWYETMHFQHQISKSPHLDSMIKTNSTMAMKILDRCISETADSRLESMGKITYNYALIDPAPNRSLTNRYFALNTMAEERTADLLNHPLCKSLLEYKWRMFGRIVYWLDCLLYIVFLCCLTTYILKLNPPQGSNTNLINSATGCITSNASGNATNNKERSQISQPGLVLVQIVILVFLCIRVLLEFIKLLAKKLRYFSNVRVYVYWLMYVMTALFIRNPKEEPCVYEWTSGICSVFLAWLLFIYQLENFPFTRINTLMFQSVLKSLAKAIVLILILIVAFALTFYICLRHSDAYSEFGKSFLKTIDMTIGELELVTYFYAESNVLFTEISYVVFTIFTIFMPIVLLNLLIGLAVGDITSIKKEAALDAIILRVQYVYEVEIKLLYLMQERLHINYKTKRKYDEKESLLSRLSQWIDPVHSYKEEFPEDEINLDDPKIGEKLNNKFQAINEKLEKGMDRIWKKLELEPY